jgi:hypothetical protein
MFACSGEPESFTTALDTHHFYETLTFTNHAINIATAAPYDTMQLHVVAAMQDGTPVPGTIVYSTTDTTIAVSPAGLLTALHPTTKAVVHASLTYNGVTRSDSAIVVVVSGSPALLKTLSLHLLPGDSAKMAYLTSNIGTSTKMLALDRLDSAGDNLSALAVSLSVSDTALATIVQSGNQAQVTAKAPGRVMLYVSTNAYGVVKRDSLSFVIGWALGVLEGVYARTQTGMRNTVLDFFPSRIVVGVGASICWQNGDTTHTIDVTFDDPSNVAPPTGLCALLSQRHLGTGNIPAWKTEHTIGGTVDAFSTYAGRSFPRAGVYPFHSEVNGSSGVIVVCDELHDSSCFPW